MAKLPQQDETPRIESGVPGLDDVLCGGLLPNRVYLIEGKTGTGKTTLALQFLLAGVNRGERCLFVTLSETEEELRISAASHGWTLDGIDILEVFASQESLTPDSRYTMYHPSEVELAETLKSVLERARRSNRNASFSTLSPSCGFWPTTRCATAGRSLRSSGISATRAR